MMRQDYVGSSPLGCPFCFWQGLLTFCVWGRIWEVPGKQECCILKSEKGGGRKESLHEQTNTSVVSPVPRTPQHLPGHWITARVSFNSLLQVGFEESPKILVDERCDSLAHGTIEK